jgi:hypothetical protein
MADEILTRADEEVSEISAQSLARGGETRPWLSVIVSFPTAE